LIKRLPDIFAILFILITVSLGVHQIIVSDDVIFNMRQIWHHETLMGIFGFGAVCLLVGKYLGRLNY
jgi:hypothetical protein